jgi:hypothetical protein
MTTKKSNLLEEFNGMYATFDEKVEIRKISSRKLGYNTIVLKVVFMTIIEDK